MIPCRSRCSGFAIVSAVFLVVIIGALGAYLTALSSTQRTTAGQTVSASRAYYGAKAGLDWAIQRAIGANTCAASSSFALSGAGFEGITVVVSCVSTTYPGVFYIVSQASYGTYGTADYAQRRVAASVSNF